MQPFRVHTGVLAPLDRANIDTDQIIPKQFLKRVERTGFGQFLFHDWRIRADGTEDPEFVLNRPRYRGASVLIAGKNFGCGSSREHAPWALADYGFRAIIAPSFADIFTINCAKNGILLVALNEQLVSELINRAAANGTREGECAEREPAYRVTVDLETCVVRDDAGFCAPFAVNKFQRRCLLNGWDDISLTLQHEEAIRAYEQTIQA